MITTGASNDLSQVANIARRMVTQWGFQDGLGLSAWEMEGGAGGFGAQAASPETEAEIDAEIVKHVSKAYAHCKKTMVENREIWEELTDMLIEKETVDYVEMQALIEKYKPDGIGSKGGLSSSTAAPAPQPNVLAQGA